jgi:hypothetical protein
VHSGAIPERRPAHPHLVLDQNVLRDESVLLPQVEAATRNGILLLIPDIAFVEMTKSEQWASTTRRSLQILSRHPECVAASHAAGPMMRQERDIGEPLADIVDHELTVRFRKFLTDARTGSGPVWDYFTRKVPEVKPEAASQSFDHARNKATIERMMNGWKDGLSSDELRRLRNHDRALVAELLAGESAVRMIRSALESNGYAPKVAAYLASVPSVSAHLILCFIASALRWLEYGGLASTPGERVTNDVNDVDYVLIASFCAGVVSMEKEVNELFADVSVALDRRWRRMREILMRDTTSTPRST